MKYVVMEELKSETQFKGKFTGEDFIFTCLYLLVTTVFSFAVASDLKVFYFIFNFIMSFLLTWSNEDNPQKRNWQTMYYMIIKDRFVYKPIEVESEVL